MRSYLVPGRIFADYQFPGMGVLSHREEGFGPEVGFYIANWVEAHEVPEAQPPIELVFPLPARGAGTC